ncbi:hypothetical protein cyc_08472 [Cyclospora cayetanensis]|uniref:Transmembrane protein n=1 Tax=Cyclospora cayetanensis TaxID=88456 RepID=A0A1D3CT30_9EIME|nr:hypothetical protein cyc_08472 [Cyclospora cayetanensis]
MGEAEAFVVYGTAAFVAVLLTTSRRVAAARLGILGLICAAAAAEVVLHHEGISPYLLELTQRREPPRSTLEAAEKSSSMQGLLETLLRQAAESASAGLALHGTSLIRWACWVASSLLWIRCFRGDPYDLCYCCEGSCHPVWALSLPLPEKLKDLRKDPCFAGTSPSTESSCNDRSTPHKNILSPWEDSNGPDTEKATAENSQQYIWGQQMDIRRRRRVSAALRICFYCLNPAYDLSRLSI